MVNKAVYLFFVFALGLSSLVEEDRYLRHRLNEEIKNIEETEENINIVKKSTDAVHKAVESFTEIESEIKSKYLQANRQYLASSKIVKVKEEETTEFKFKLELSQVEQIDKEIEEFAVLADLLGDSSIRQMLKEVKPELDFKEEDINAMKIKVNDVKSLVKAYKDKISTKSKEEQILEDNKEEAEKEEKKVNKLVLMIKMLKHDKVSGQKLTDAQEKLKNISRIHINKVKQGKTAIGLILKESTDLLETIKEKQIVLVNKHNDLKHLFTSVLTENKFDEYEKKEEFYFNLLKKCFNIDISVFKAKNTLKLTKEKKEYYLQKCKDSCEEYKEKLEELDLQQKQMEQDLKTAESKLECSKLGEKRQEQLKWLEIAESSLILDQFKDKPIESVDKLKNSLIAYFKATRLETNAKEYSQKSKISQFEQVSVDFLNQKERNEFYNAELAKEEQEMSKLKEKDFDLKPEDQEKFKEFLKLKIELDNQVKIKTELENTAEIEGNSIVWLYIAIGIGILIILGGAAYVLLSLKKKNPDESINTQNAKLAQLP